mgnify:FL=1
MRRRMGKPSNSRKRLTHCDDAEHRQPFDEIKHRIRSMKLAMSQRGRMIVL